MATRGRGFTPNGLVTLTTDFGSSDGYVGAMKGVLLSVDASLRLHDLAHDLPPQDVEHAAGVVRAACPWFPPGTVHLAVVDPGVGTARAPVVVRAGGQVFVAPDNGLLGPVLAELGGATAVRRIDPEGRLGPWLRADAHTFHGRDLFAPAAALLATGRVAVTEVGPPHTLLTWERVPPRREADGGMTGRVTDTDRFGNVVTDIHRAMLDGVPLEAMDVVLADGRRLPMLRTYGEVPPGEALGLFGSEGFVEIAVRGGSARNRLGLRRGATVRVAVRS